jgi:hypothetical protein
MFRIAVQMNLTQIIEDFFEKIIPEFRQSFALCQHFLLGDGASLSKTDAQRRW